MFGYGVYFFTHFMLLPKCRYAFVLVISSGARLRVTPLDISLPRAGAAIEVGVEHGTRPGIWVYDFYTFVNIF